MDRTNYVTAHNHMSRATLVYVCFCCTCIFTSHCSKPVKKIHSSSSTLAIHATTGGLLDKHFSPVQFASRTRPTAYQYHLTISSLAFHFVLPMLLVSIQVFSWLSFCFLVNLSSHSYFMMFGCSSIVGLNSIPVILLIYFVFCLSFNL